MCGGWSIGILLVFSPFLVSGLYSGSDVQTLTSSNFDRLVKESDAVWIIEFFAPWCGHCKSLAPEYSKAAKALKGVVKVGAVNADEENSLASQYNIKGFPTIKIFYGKKVEDYNGQRNSQGIIEAALKAVRSKVEAQSGGSSGGGSDKNTNVIELTDSNFASKVLNSDEPWLVEFFAPWCGHCKQLAPEWEKAASALQGKIKLGALDATVHSAKASEYNIRGYPTIKFFPAGKKGEPIEYDGGRTAQDIIAWASDKYEANIPPPELVQITDDDKLSTGCKDNSICIISVLPHILDCDATCRNSYLGILTRQGDKFKRQQWGWIWSQAGDYLNLEEALDIGGFGYPAMAAVNLKKGKYSLFRGSFSDDGIGEFLRDLSYGRGSVSPLRGASLPTLPTVEPWDGRDGQPPLEENFDDKDEL
jgi:protein disulfide-isomerase A6